MGIVRLWEESESSAVIWKDAQEEAARKGAQLAAEKEKERKRKYQEVEDEAEAEEDSFECHSFISACPSKNLQELVEEEPTTPPPRSPHFPNHLS